MIGIFIYLTAYTIAMAVGYTQADAEAIARTVRCAQEDARDIKELYQALRYLPGEPEAAIAAAAPSQAEDPAAARHIALVCSPSGETMEKIVDWAARSWALGEPGRQQAAGIVLCALANAILHQDFCGLESQSVNGASSIMKAKPMSAKELREVLQGIREGRPLEELAELEPYTPEPSSSYLGCAQLGGLEEQAGELWTYQSPWKSTPTVTCAGPLRFAQIYLGMRAVLARIRSGETNSILDSAENPVDLAVSFAQAPWEEKAFTQWWWSRYDWCEVQCKFKAPAGSEDMEFLSAYSLCLLDYRDLVLRTRPDMIVGTVPDTDTDPGTDPDTGTDTEG